MLDNVVGWSSAIATLVSFISVGGVLYLIFRSSTDSPIFKYTATLVATLLVVPSIFQYMIFPYIGLLPAIYLAEEGAHRVRLGLGLILISIPITRYKINNLIEILAGPSLSVPEWVLSLMNVPFWGMILLLAALYLLSREEEGHTSLSPENP
jgi:hypothetical protein